MDNEGPEPSLIEYARLHGLAVDHTSEEDALRTHYALSTSFSSTDTSDLTASALPLNSIVVDERLSLDGPSRALLASIVEILQHNPFDTIDDAFTYRKQLKLDLSVLKSDNELDIKLFKITRTTSDPLPPLREWQVDVELDEGLTWPSHLKCLPQEYTEQHQAEKLQLSAEALLSLQSAVTAAHHVVHEVLNGELDYRSSQKKARITPYLSPLVSPISAIDQLEDVPNTKIFFEPQTSSAKRADLATERLLEEDDGIWGVNSVGEEDHTDNNTHFELPHLSPPSSERLVVSSPLARKASKMKVEEPLSPPQTIEAGKHVTWSDDLNQIIPNLPHLERPSSTSSADLEALFQNLINPEALKVENDAQHETLDEPDTMVKLPLPVVAVVTPTPPWQNPEPSLTEENDIKLVLLLIAKLKCHHWSVSRFERSLPWVPVMLHPEKTAFDEFIDYKGLVARFVDVITQAELVDVDTLTWKPEGLRVLDNNDDEDEVEPGEFEEETSISGLTGKRKLAINAVKSLPQPTTCITNRVETGSLLTDLSHIVYEPKPMSSHLFDFSFASAADQLDHFIDMQSGHAKRRKITIAQERSTTEAAACDANVVDTDRSNARHPNPIETGQLPLVAPLPAPPIAAPNTPRPMFVRSSILSQRRQLIKHITHFYPGVELVSRNAADSRKGEDETLLADFALSAGIGVICTTLQGLKQKPLPGQEGKDKALIRERIVCSASQFEKLFVLVTQGKKNVVLEITIDGRDCLALTELIQFVTTLEEEVEVIFVGGGEEDLARWITGLLGVSPSPAEGLNVLQDETTWEQWLCKAGLNPFAAQAVLSELKAPSDADEDMMDAAQGSSYGLAAFVEMPSDDRIARLEHILGGKKLLQRISGVFNTPWVRHGKA